jgi:predicted enzyme related to lactoylglutathione lyase
MGQPVAMFEVTSRDHERAQAFYSQLFDWKVQPDPTMGGYGLVDTGAGESAMLGGIGPAGGDDRGGVKIYVRVDDLGRYLDRAETLGGKPIVPPTELPGGFGSFAIFADPDGNPVGLWAS